MQSACQFTVCLLLLLCSLSPSLGLRDTTGLPEAAAIEPLTINFCETWQGAEFVCDKILGHFCTYCTKKDEPRKSDQGICMTKKGVKRAESGAPRPQLAANAH